jgi:hypothetical protein
MPNISQLATSLTTGAEWQSFFYKTTGPGTFGTRWADMSMGAGIPKYNAYVGSQNVATPFVGAGNDGIYRPSSAKYIANVQMIPASTSTSASWILADYLMHYPLTDGDSTDQQDMDNTLTLPRYSGGQVMLVATTPQTANALCTIGYTNDVGTSGRVTTVGIQSSTVVGCIINSHDLNAGSLSPFVPLANGDKGVRSIEYITLQGGVGGFFAAVIVKPLTTLSQPEAITVESSELIQKGRMPEILPGAYLNWIMCAGVSAAATPFRGHIQYAW